MRRSNEDHPVERLLAALPGWIFLLGGVALLAMSALTPDWLEVRDLRWQRDLIKAQADRLMAQTQRFAEFDQALAEEDPILLERLAFAQLRLKPTGKHLLEQPGTLPVAEGAYRLDPRFAHVMVDDWRGQSAAVEDWLRTPLPQLGTEVPKPPAIKTRMTRLAAGRHRPLLIAAGILCLAGGLWWSKFR